MNCKYCGADLPTKERGHGGHRSREYCNDAHRQAYWRQQHQADQNAALLAELAQLRTQVKDQEQEIEEQAREITNLKQLITVDTWWHTDTKRRGLAHYLRTHPSTPLGEKLLSDPWLRTQGPQVTRSLIESRIRYNDQYNGNDLEVEFPHLWKALILAS